jgi:hypothetical protein
METKRKMSLAAKGRPVSKEQLLRLKKWALVCKGKHHSEETKEKMRLARKGRTPNKGKKFSKEWRRKISTSHIKRWDRTGRKKYKRYIHPRDKKYLQWRSGVFARDNWTCQTCGKRGITLEAHHIKSWAKYIKLRYKLENGVALCLECHKLTDNYKHRRSIR